MMGSKQRRKKRHIKVLFKRRSHWLSQSRNKEELETEGDESHVKNVESSTPSQDNQNPVTDQPEVSQSLAIKKRRGDESLTQRSSKRIAQSMLEELRQRKIITNRSKVATNEPNPKWSKKDSEGLDEFDIFGRFIAAQLKSLTEEDAVLAQSEIQEVLIRYRLNKIKTRYEVPVLGEQVPSPSVSPGQPFQSSQINVETLIFKCEPNSD